MYILVVCRLCCYTASQEAFEYGETEMECPNCGAGESDLEDCQVQAPPQYMHDFNFGR